MGRGVGSRGEGILGERAEGASAVDEPSALVGDLGGEDGTESDSGGSRI